MSTDEQGPARVKRKVVCEFGDGYCRHLRCRFADWISRWFA